MYHEHQRQSRSKTTSDGHGLGPSEFSATVLSKVWLFVVFFFSGESVWHHLSWIFGSWMGNGEPLIARDFHLGCPVCLVVMCGA